VVNLKKRLSSGTSKSRNVDDSNCFHEWSRSGRSGPYREPEPTWWSATRCLKWPRLGRGPRYRRYSVRTCLKVCST
jgi:hypothetical protein